MYQGRLPANPRQQMSFQTSADLEPLSNCSRRAEGGDRGIVIGQTKDDITGMILVIYWKWPASYFASSVIVAWWPIERLFASYLHFIHLIKPIKPSQTKTAALMTSKNAPNVQSTHIIRPKIAKRKKKGRARAIVAKCIKCSMLSTGRKQELLPLFCLQSIMGNEVH